MSDIKLLQNKLYSKFAATAAILASSTMVALAHPGHVETVSGHNHWLSYAAAGVSIFILIAAVLLRKRAKMQSKR